jgi:hypothetical protein
VTENLAAAGLFFMGTVLFAFSVAILGVGAHWFGRAVREAHTARAHAAQADETQDTVAQATAALAHIDETPQASSLDNPVNRPYERPTDADLMAALIARRNGRAYPNEDEFTTEGNEGIPETPPIPETGMYRTEHFDA